MKKINISVALALLALVITAFLIFLNDIVITIRLNELKADLLNMDRQESSLDHISLIATYQINKNIYEKKLTQENADTIEARIISLLKKEKRSGRAVDASRYKIISRPALWIINFNRNIIGKAPLTYYLAHDEDMAELDIAYYYERNFLFVRAIALYEKVLKNSNLDNALRASILLHKGYCHALAGLNEKAMKDYSTIINNYGQESSAITATILMRYLEGFKQARERVLSSKADPLLRSQDLVNLLAYEQALGILQQAELNAGPADLPRIKYFIARCYTGMGKPEKAIENYVQVITASPSSQYAKLSNRKIFLIGSRLGGENDLVKISKRLNDTIKDPVLSQMIQNQKENPEEAENIKNLVKPKLPEILIEKLDKIKEEKDQPLRAGSHLIIQTSDGNKFIGSLVEQNQKEIVLQTSIGIVNIKRDKITSIIPK